MTRTQTVASIRPRGTTRQPYLQYSRLSSVPGEARNLSRQPADGGVSYRNIPPLPPGEGKGVRSGYCDKRLSSVPSKARNLSRQSAKELNYGLHVHIEINVALL
jgi:hypothetical protein